MFGRAAARPGGSSAATAATAAAPASPPPVPPVAAALPGERPRLSGSPRGPEQQRGSAGSPPLSAGAAARRAGSPEQRNGAAPRSASSPKPASARAGDRRPRSSVGGAASSPPPAGPRAKLRQELRSILAGHFAQLPAETIDRLITWKLTGHVAAGATRGASAGAAGPDGAHAEGGAAASPGQQPPSPTSGVEGASAATTPLGRAAGQPGSPTGARFQIVVRSADGEVLLERPNAHSGLKRHDIVKHLKVARPLPATEHYKLTCADGTVLGAGRTLKDCGAVPEGATSVELTAVMFEDAAWAEMARQHEVDSNTICKLDLVELRNFARPPAPAKLCVMALGMVARLEVRVPKSAPREQKMEAYWAAAKDNLLEPKSFYSFFQRFDRDAMDARQIVAMLSPLLAEPSMDPEYMKTVSKASYGICLWLHALLTYSRFLVDNDLD